MHPEKIHGSALATNTSSLTASRWVVGLLLGILLMTVCARVTVAIATTSWVFPTDRNSWNFAFEMGRIGASLASGDGFSWPEGSSHPRTATAWMPPIYPFLIAAAFKMFGVYSDQAAIFLLSVQVILSTLTCFFLYMVGSRIFNIWVGLLSAFFFALYPPSIHFAVQKIWSTSLFVCCLLLIILSLLKLKTQMNATNSIWFGILTGFTALVDPIILVVYPFVILWLYLKSSHDRVATCKFLSLTAIVFFLSMCPWLIRNYMVFGRYVFVKSNFGNELFLGNNAYASGSFHSPGSQETLKTLSDAERAFLETADEPSRNELLLQKALVFIYTQPLQFLRLTISRFIHYWTVMMRPMDNTQMLSLVVYFLLLALGILGLLMSNPKAPDVQLIWLFLMLLPVPYYFTVVGLFRYRFPVEAILVVPAAYSAYRLFLSIRGHRLLAGSQTSATVLGRS